MEIYTGHCSYCNQPIKYQNNWIKHTKTKKHLRNKEKYPKTAENRTKTAQNPHKTRTNIQNAAESIEKIEKIYKCEYCSKTFKRKDSVKRHIDKYCKVKKKENEKDELIKELKKQLENNNQNNNTTNNTTNNNGDTTTTTNNNNTLNDNKIINQTINLNVHGRESILFDDSFLHKLSNPMITDTDRCKMILEKVYIDIEENRTLQITNLRSVWGKIFTGNDNWLAVKSKEQIQERMRKIPITYNRGAKECIENWGEADEDFKKAQLAIHKKFSNNIRTNTLNNKKKVSEIYDAHRENLYNYH